MSETHRDFRGGSGTALWHLARAGSGFRLRRENDAGDGETWDARPDPDGAGWRLAGSPALDGAILSPRSPRAQCGAVLRLGGTERGRLLVPPGDDSIERATLLLDDGRLWCIRPRAPRDPGFDLTGWEVRGAYLVARPAGPLGNDWRIETTPAGDRVEGLPELLVLFAVRLLAAG